jgi:hypothetical protein
LLVHRKQGDFVSLSLRDPDGVLPGLGARIGARFFTSSAAQPFADLTAAWLLRAATPAFQVGTREVLAPSALVFGLALGIATPF